MKTVLAPNAPWPKTEPVKKPYRQREVGLKTVRISTENGSLDYFLSTHEELNRSKISATRSKTASANRVRDKLSGRFTNRDRMA